MKILRKKRFLIPIIIILIVVLAIKFSGGNKSSNIVMAEITTFEKTVSVSGKVIPVEKVDLSFESGGTVQRISKDVGQRVSRGELIAQLDASDLIAERKGLDADLDEAVAELAKLKNSNTNTEIFFNKQDVLNTIVSSVTDSDDALNNKVDQFFKNPESDSPQILYTFGDYFNLRTQINDKRSDVEDVFTSWSKSVDSLTVDNVSTIDVETAKKSLYSIKDFLDLVSKAVNTFESSNNLSQTTIDKYKSDVSTARNNINEAISDLVKVENSLRDSLSNVPVLEAKIRSVEAKIAKNRAEISKTIITAPFSGVISEKEIELGQSVPQNQKAFTLIGSSLEIEAFIPEINLPGITVGNKVTIKLDAYSDEEFFGTISRIDPAETEKDGVSNYKVKISFDNTDERIKSGMTSDVWIVTAKRENVLLIPLRAVTKENGKAFVFVPNNKESIKTEVVLGENDGKGSVEILSGITDGQELILNQE